VLPLPLIGLLGGLVVLIKGVFLLRRSSEGLALTQRELDDLSAPANRKVLPPAPVLFAQLIQDFGTGALVLGPFLLSFEGSLGFALPTLFVFLGGVVLVAAGWLIRYLAGSQRAA